MREDNHLANIMAVVGLIVMICLLAWLAVQLVRFIPTTFSRLAEVYDNNRDELADRTDDDENVVIVNEDEEDEEVEETPGEEEEVDETPAPTGSDMKPTPTPVPTPKPTPVQYRTVVTYVTPVSNPNGYTDLAATFVAVGKMTSQERFVAANHLEEDERSAMQFKVTNIGTKTSGEWRFAALLPDGSTMNSPVQRPLKPNETATLTIVFDGVDGNKDRKIGVDVTGGNDNNSKNNGFRVTVDVK